MSDTEAGGGAWREQEIIDAWIKRHQLEIPNNISIELKKEFTDIRVFYEGKLERIRAIVGEEV